MQIDQLMTRDVWTCRPRDSLFLAAQIFWERDCGCVPVVDDERHVIGIVTDRDALIAAYTRGRPLCEIEVATAMSKGVIFCRSDDPIAVAEELMRANQIRRIPVVGDNGTLEGIVSLNDLACEAARQRSSRQGELTTADIGEALSDVCRPRSVPEPMAMT